MASMQVEKCSEEVALPSNANSKALDQIKGVVVDQIKGVMDKMHHDQAAKQQVVLQPGLGPTQDVCGTLTYDSKHAERSHVQHSSCESVSTGKVSPPCEKKKKKEEKKEKKEEKKEKKEKKEDKKKSSETGFGVMTSVHSHVSTHKSAKASHKTKDKTKKHNKHGDDSSSSSDDDAHDKKKTLEKEKKKFK